MNAEKENKLISSLKMGETVYGMSADLPIIEKYRVLYSEPSKTPIDTSNDYTIGLSLVGDVDEKVDREITTHDREISEIANIGLSPESALEKTSNMIEEYINRLHNGEVTKAEMSHIAVILDRVNYMLFDHFEKTYKSKS